MENEIIENGIVEGVEAVDEVATYNGPDGSNRVGGVIPLISVALLAVGGTVGALIYKNRAKLEERRIEKLRKKGYVITKVDVIDEDDSVSEENED